MSTSTCRQTWRHAEVESLEDKLRLPQAYGQRHQSSDKGSEVIEMDYGTLCRRLGELASTVTKQDEIIRNLQGQLHDVLAHLDLTDGSRPSETLKDELCQVRAVLKS